MTKDITTFAQWLEARRKPHESPESYKLVRAGSELREIVVPGTVKEGGHLET